VSERAPPDGPRTSRRARAARWLRARWRGEGPLGEVFWNDMLLVGTGINVATTLAAMALLASEAPTALAAAVFFAPLPVNLFLLVAVWRSAEAAPPGLATAARLAAALWFLAATAL
jgi:hypothetical protein